MRKKSKKPKGTARPTARDHEALVAEPAPPDEVGAAGDASADAPDANDAGGEGRFPVVGLGASAGGLQALEDFFSKMPDSPGMAFVIVTHQHAGHASLMAELLGRRTSLPVVEVSEPMRVEPDHVYTIRPGNDVALLGGVLRPTPVASHVPQPMPIDFFFRSLAHDQGDRAIGVVLSGTGSDGSLGVKEIKGALGLVIAQEEATAQYGGMPRSAIATDVVDQVLPASEIPAYLVEYTRTAAQARPRKPGAEPSAEELGQIFVLVRSRTGHDFSQYKESTVCRRIERRMAIHHIDTMKRYVRFLQTQPAEISLLFKELLIGVTSFFRDPEAWESLAPILREVLAEKPDDHVVRAWVPGCSTGEEAYSLAILLRELMDELGRSMSVQIFATDLDEEAVDVARAGVYPAGIANDVSSKRLGRFFTREEDAYRVKKEVREMVVFAPQNLVGDPPFTKLDVLCCRNLLIYLNANLQRKLLPIFHYALRRKGILFLGSSETVGAFGDLFLPKDRRWKVFQRSEVALGAYVTELPTGRPGVAGAGVPPVGPAGPQGESTLTHAIERMLVRDLVPPTILMRERGDVVHIHGRTGLFLEPAQGLHASANVFNMARQGLSISLSAAIRQAAAEDREVTHRGVRVKTNGDFTAVDIKVQRLKEPEALRGLFRVAFVNAAPAAAAAESPSVAADGTISADRVKELERELQYTKESHQGTIEELETANEELKSTNEELQSTNEELQSANEELETSKEEMQSLNEELQTVNAELQGKVEELSRANNDMRNLLNSTDIATIFLDDDLQIKRFTEQAKKVVRLIPSDVGRPIGDLVSTLDYDRLIEDAREVLRTLVPRETEVRGAGGAWYLMRILPYRTTENVISGLVLTFVDISKLRVLEAEQRHLLEALKGSPTTVFVNDTELRYTWARIGAFGRKRSDLEGKTDAEVFGEEAARPLVECKERALAEKKAAWAQMRLPLGDKHQAYGVYMEPLRNAAGEVVGLTCAATVTGSATAGPSEETASS